jgi:hypothetical protein
VQTEWRSAFWLLFLLAPFRIFRPSARSSARVSSTCACPRTPRASDLRSSGTYVLHALLGAHDEEVPVAGRAREVSDTAERAAVHAAIRFAAFGREDPIFHLAIERALWVHWERVGQPDTRPVRRRFRSRVQEKS